MQSSSEKALIPGPISVMNHLPTWMGITVHLRCVHPATHPPPYMCLDIIIIIIAMGIIMTFACVHYCHECRTYAP